MAELVARIDGAPPHRNLPGESVTHADVGLSPTLGASRGAERGIYAICVPMDELSSDAGDQREEHHTDVGYLPRMCLCIDCLQLSEDLTCGIQAEGPDAFSQFHLYVCSAFLVKWSEKLRQMDFQVRSIASCFQYQSIV